tara:strand:- start:288 stop:671 length:384 start_codon:yes stop_codon:yes gene_type:complete
MKKQDLPLSPHLQIYKPQITSLLSISHRISGVALNFVLIILVLGLLCITLGESYFELLISLINSFPIKIIIFLAILGFSYHFLNGIRHIIWDFGFLLGNRSSAIFGYFIIATSFISSIFISRLLGLF